MDIRTLQKHNVTWKICERLHVTVCKSKKKSKKKKKVLIQLQRLTHKCDYCHLARSWSWISTQTQRNSITPSLRSFSALGSLAHFPGHPFCWGGGRKQRNSFTVAGWLPGNRTAREAVVTRVKESSGRIHRVSNMGRRTISTCCWFPDPEDSVLHFRSYFHTNIIPVTVQPSSSNYRLQPKN